MRHRTSICILLTMTLLFLLISVPSAAIVAEVTGGNLTESQNEGELIQYTISVSGIPKQTQTLEMRTDLVPVPGTPLWQLEGDGFTVSGGEEALNDHTIELTEDGEFTDGINVTVSGRVPVLTTVEIVDGVVVTRQITQTTGYLYYSIAALDGNRDILGTATTATFSVTIPDDEVFQERLNTVTNPSLRVLIDDLYSRGLRGEAKDLLEYAETPEEAAIPMTMFLIIGVVLLVIGFVGGMVFGQIRARNMQELQNDYKGN